MTERPEFVQSLARGIAVIRAFSAQNPRLTLSDVARETGLSRAAARRFLITLEELGYVASDGRMFSLRPSVLQIGYAYLSSLTLAQIAQDHLEHLAQEFHESCSASVLDGDEIVYVARAATSRIMAINLSVGTRLPAYCTSMGRVLLAALEDAQLDAYLDRATLTALTPRTITDKDALREEILQVRRQGWCLLDQELEQGVRSIAFPLHDADHRVVAAANASAHATRVGIEEMREKYIPALRACAAQIDRDLAGARY